LWTNPGDQKGRGRSKSRLFDVEEEEGRRVGFSNWLEGKKDTGRWRRTNDEAKAHPGLWPMIKIMMIMTMMVMILIMMIYILRIQVASKLQKKRKMINSKTHDRHVGVKMLA
jgi:hypothetical protein